MDNPIKMDDLGAPLFLETPILKMQHKIHIFAVCRIDMSMSVLLAVKKPIALFNMIVDGKIPGSNMVQKMYQAEQTRDSQNQMC